MDAKEVERRSNEFAHRMIVAIGQKAYRDPYTGRTVVPFTDSLYDEIMADMGECWNCAGLVTVCSCEKKRLADYSPAERKAMRRTAAERIGGNAPDSAVLFNGEVEFRFIDG